jgi:hypothetical protein
MQRRIHDNSLANLKRFQPGQSGNPGGRRAGESLTAILRQALSEEKQTGKNKGLSNSQIIVNALIAAATSQNITAIKEILDRIDGPVEKRHIIEEAGASVIAKAVEAFGFYSELNAKYQAKYGISLSRDELISNILRPIPAPHQQMALEAIEEEFPALMAQN